MIVCDSCGLQYLDWGRDEMCPRCKNNVKEIDDYDKLKRENPLLLSRIEAAEALINSLYKLADIADEGYSWHGEYDRWQSTIRAMEGTK